VSTQNSKGVGFLFKKNKGHEIKGTPTVDKGGSASP
jgi:hypothetical protein